MPSWRLLDGLLSNPGKPAYLRSNLEGSTTHSPKSPINTPAATMTSMVASTNNLQLYFRQQCYGCFSGLLISGYNLPEFGPAVSTFLGQPQPVLHFKAAASVRSHAIPG